MYRLVTLTFVIILGLIVGCSGNGKKTTADNANPGVLNVAAAPTPAPAPMATEPVALAPSAEPQQLAYASTAAPAAPAKTTGSYTVKRGDTLFSIAKTSYGNGNQWKKIVAANPGLEPSKLRAGQTITIP